MKYGSFLLLCCVALVGGSDDIANGSGYYRKRRNLVFPGGGQILVKKFWLEILRIDPRFVEFQRVAKLLYAMQDFYIVIKETIIFVLSTTCIIDK